MIRAFAVFIALAVVAIGVLEAGTISGNVNDAITGKPLAGIRIAVKGTNNVTRTNDNGEFSINNLRPGNYVVAASGPGWITEERTSTVADDVIGVVRFLLRSTARNANEVIVYGASRRPQKLTDAPAAVGVVTPLDAERMAPTGQIARTMERMPGVDVVMSGANDFNVNTRGFNNSINRRTLVLIDGRDPSTPLINLNEWNSMSAIMDDVAGIDVVRGPGSALYGQNAYNGVVNIRTSAPRDVLGTKVTLAAGEWETYRSSVRHAGLFGDLAYKFTFGASTQYNYGVVPRLTEAEYPALTPALAGANAFDKRPLSDAARRPYQIGGTMRFDYDLHDDQTVLFEGGYTASGNEMYVNQTGRLLVQRVEKPFVRVAYTSPSFTVQGLWQRRNTPDELQQLVYNANARSLERSDVMGVDAQYNTQLAEGIRVIAGAQYDYQDVSSPTDSAGVFLPDMTLISPTRVTAIFAGVYGHLEVKATDNITLVGSARIDHSRLFPTQVSPKLAVVFEPSNGHTLRLTLNRAFLRPSYTELFRRSPFGGPANLAAAEAVVDSVLDARFGAGVRSNLGLSQPAARFNLGNPNLQPEKALSFELGYRGAVTNDLWVSADVYYNRRTDLISAPLAGITPGVYAPVRSNSGNAEADRVADSVLQAQIGVAPFNQLSMYEGRPTLVIAPNNVAAVDEYGAELTATYAISNELTVTAAYAYFDFSIASNEAAAQKIVPNTSRHRANIDVNYAVPSSFDAGVNVRWVNAFTWLAGAFEGTVPTYTVVNLQAGYFLTPTLRLGVNVFNALDNAHIQIFGGTILRRQASVSASYTF
jgi:iron complex outermembrane receptor protein